MNDRITTWLTRSGFTQDERENVWGKETKISAMNCKRSGLRPHIKVEFDEEQNQGTMTLTAENKRGEWVELNVVFDIEKILISGFRYEMCLVCAWREFG